MAPLIPDHTLLRPIGRGAYGEVWLACNVMGALRAVKIIRREQFESERPYEREFAGIQRYEPVSRTSGGLVHVLHVGRNDAEGYFYYVTELADDALSGQVSHQLPVISNPSSGAATDPSLNTDYRSLITAYTPRTLRSDLKRLGRLPTGDCLRLALEVVSGLAQLHRQGLVHRDVKPGNIIYVNGRAKLADIGLVTVPGEGRTFVGTEGYIPPEGPGSPGADIYALGVVLYEASTGRAPEQFPDVPGEWFAESAGDATLELHEVILKACEGQRERRYQTADEMQADLALLQSGQSIRRVRALERRYGRLRLAGVVGTSLLVCALVTLLLSHYRAHVAAENEARETALRKQAQMSLARAQAAERQESQQLYAALLEQARATVRSGEVGQRVRALDAVRRAAAISNSIELRREAVAALALPDLRFERELFKDDNMTMAVLDPAFERLAVCIETNAVEIRSTSDQRLLRRLSAPTPQIAWSGQWSPDGRFLAVRRRKDNQSPSDVEVWDVTGGKQLLQLRGTPWGALSFHPTRPRVLCSDREDSAALLDLESGREMARFSVTGSVLHLEFSPDGQSFVAQHRIGWPWFTSLFDAQTGTKRRTVPSSDWVDGLAWDPLDRWIALAVRTGEICLLDPRSGETSIIGRHKSEARTAAFSPDGTFLFTGGEEQEIICWDLRLKERAFSIGSQSPRFQIGADGKQCAVITRNAVLLHSFERLAPRRELAGDLGGGLRHAAFSSDGRWLAVGGMYRLGLWDLAGEAPAAIAVEAEYAKPFFSPDSGELFAFWERGLARWRVQPAAGTNCSAPLLTPQPVPKTSRVHSGHFVSNSLVLGTEEGTLVFPSSNIASGSAELFPEGPMQGQVSPNGLWIAARFSRFLYVYRLKPWQSVGAWAMDSESWAHVFTPGSDELAVASSTRVTFLDTNRWAPKRMLSIPLDRNAQLIFTPDGRSFWLASDARTAALYDTQSFERLLPLPTGMHPLALSPDGRHLAVSIDARRVQLWDLVELKARLRELGLDW
jgi:WD40 repeat protein